MFNHSKHLYEFGNFKLDVENPGLWSEGQLVSIPPKVLETLILLVERNGEIVLREELLETVWKETFVEEGNINYTISQLRKIIGEKDLIQTVPKKGYRFLGKIERVVNAERNELPEQDAILKLSSSNFPQLPSLQTPKRGRWLASLIILSVILGITAVAIRSKNDGIVTSTVDQKSNESRPETVEALQFYTRGKMILDDRDGEKRGERAIEEFQKAVTLDPTLAVAHAGLAEGLVSLAVASSGAKANDFYAKSKIAVNRAIALDENLAEAYTTRGLIRRNSDWDFKGAEEDYLRATELKPNYALAHTRYAHLLSPLGRQDEAIAEINKAYLLDPLSEAVLISQFAVLEARGEYDLAISRAEEFLTVNPQNPPAQRGLGIFLYHTGEYQKVIEIGEKIVNKTPDRKPFAWLSLLAASYQKSGQPDKAGELLAELETQAENNSKARYALAMNYAENNQIEKAIEALQKCFNDHEEKMVWLKVEPRFSNLRSNKDFQAIVEKMNFKTT
jgi:DNA-binding winged helix-turn-helix (wHTH) protein/Flp pilus assembly protein TadD